MKQYWYLLHCEWEWNFKTKSLKSLCWFWSHKKQSNILKPYWRSSRPELFCKKDVLKDFAEFTGNYSRQRLFFDKKLCNFIKKRLQRGCFPVNFPKFLRTLFLQNTSGRMLQLLVSDLEGLLASSCKSLILVYF